MECIKCGFTLSSMGFDCTPVMEVAYTLAFQQTYDGDNNRNGIPIADAIAGTIDQAYLQALIDEEDDTKRLFVLPPMKNIKDDRAESKFYEFDDQTKELLLQGARVFASIIAGGNSGANSPQMVGLINQWKAKGFSAYIFSTKNQLIGNLNSEATKIEGIEVDSGSLDALLKKKSNEMPQHIATTFNWAPSMKDENLYMFNCNEIGDANLLGLRSPLNICYELIEITTTTLKFILKSLFGTVTNPILAEGLVTNDFVSSDSAAVGKIYNATDDADVTITGAAESPDGTYELTFAAQTLGDVLVPYAKKSGYDFRCMKENPVDIES